MDHRLVLLRHAKSDYPEEIPDHERPLARRGSRDAPRIGEWLRASGFVPDLVLCSTAQRARQTWELAAPAVGGSPAVRYEDRIYEASALRLLMLVRELSEDFGTALFVGHNPGIGELAAGLTNSAPLSFPTAAVAVLGIEGPWLSATPGEGCLLASVSPAALR